MPINNRIINISNLTYCIHVYYLLIVNCDFVMAEVHNAFFTWRVEVKRIIDINSNNTSIIYSQTGRLSSNSNLRLSLLTYKYNMIYPTIYALSTFP